MFKIEPKFALATAVAASILALVVLSIFVVQLAIWVYAIDPALPGAIAFIIAGLLVVYRAYRFIFDFVIDRFRDRDLEMEA